MGNCAWVLRIPMKVLVVVPVVCASFIAIFLLLLMPRMEPRLGDFEQGAVCGVLFGISLLCLIAMGMKKRLAREAR